MDVLVYLIPIALGLGFLGLAAFMWALRSGQFEDLDGAAERILFDDDEALPEETDGMSDPHRQEGRSKRPELPDRVAVRTRPHQM